MIRPDQIPDEVVEELHAIFADDFGTLIPKGSCRAAIAAALNEWPGWAISPYAPVEIGKDYLILPLPQKDGDA